MIPVRLSEIQAIDLSRKPQATAPCRKSSYRTMRAGERTKVRFGPTTACVSPCYAAGCGVPTQLVAVKPEAKIAIPCVDRTMVETFAAGVSEGMRRAPISTVAPAPWSSPFAYRSKRYPRSTRVVLSTFGAADSRSIQVQKALQGYQGANLTVNIIPITATVPAVVFAFQAPDNYVADELVISCQSMAIQTNVQWEVTVGGTPMPSPVPVIDGRMKLDAQASRGQTIAVCVVLHTSDSFAVGAEILVNGWTFPSINSTDGTFNKILRSSPSWPRERFLK